MTAFLVLTVVLATTMYAAVLPAHPPADHSSVAYRFQADQDTIAADSHLSGVIDLDVAVAGYDIYDYSIDVVIAGPTKGRFPIKPTYDQIRLPLGRSDRFGFSHPVFLLKSEGKYIFDHAGEYEVRFITRLSTGHAAVSEIVSGVQRVVVTNDRVPRDYAKITRQPDTVMRAFADYNILDDLREIVSRDQLSPLLGEYLLYQAGGDYIVYGYLAGTVVDQFHRYGLDAVAAWAGQNCAGSRFICDLWRALDEIAKGNPQASRVASRLIDPR